MISDKLSKQQPYKSFLSSADENQKLSKIGILSQPVKFVDTAEKVCPISIDEYFTKIICAQREPIDLANITSARILTKVGVCLIRSDIYIFATDDLGEVGRAW